MLQAKRAAFEQQYGFRSDSIQSREYRQLETLKRLAVRCISVAHYKPGMESSGPSVSKTNTSPRAVEFYLLHVQRDIRG